MSADLRSAADDYLAGRRARGYQLADHDYLINSFLDDLENRGITKVTVADALAFARRPETGDRWHAARLRVLRGLAGYIHALDPAAAELIPTGLIRAQITRRRPYLYSRAQIGMLMDRSSKLSPSMLGATMHTLIGLLATTGMRSGEAFGLDIDHLDRDRHVLHVTGKYGKKRIVPLHLTTIEALANYERTRGERAQPSGPLFVGAKGGRLNANTARAVFRSVVDECGLRAQPGCGQPRLHDLRHTFAVDSLIDAQRSGADVDARVATLADYLGHVDPTCTYWYLTASAELMGAVSDRVADFQRKGRR